MAAGRSTAVALPLAAGAPIVPPYMLAGRSGLYMEGVGLRAGELGRLLLSDLTNGSVGGGGGGGGWADELTVAAARGSPRGPQVAVPPVMGGSFAIPRRMGAGRGRGGAGD